jgi:hypothetical protein
MKNPSFPLHCGGGQHDFHPSAAWRPPAPPAPFKALLPLLVIVTILVAGAAAFAAQSVQATLLGTVLDQHGKVIAGATVTVVSEETNRARSVRSSDEGLFVVTHLAPGPYRLTAEAPGFRAFVEIGIPLEAGEVRRVEASLQVGPVSEEVTVVAPLGRLNSDTMTTGQTVTSRLVTELPLNERNYVALAVLAPGVYHRVAADEQGEGLSASGARGDSASFSLDGMVNRTDRNGAPGLVVPVEAIREFEVQTSSYPADTGRTGGAQVSVVTRSGTNRLSGSLSNYLRDAALSAPNKFAAVEEEPELKRHQATVTLGGPLRRDRLFFFGSYERLYERRALSVNTTAPKEAWLRGDFRDVRGPGPDGIWGNSDDSNRIVDPLTRREFPTPNVIPDSMIDPTARRILPFLPAANLSGTLDGYRSTGRFRDDTHTTLARLDGNAREWLAFSARWASAWSDGYDPFAAQRNFYPGFGRMVELNQHSALLSLTVSLAGGWLNETRIGYFRRSQDTAGEHGGVDYLYELGLPASTSSALYRGFPSIRIDGFSEFGDRPNDPGYHDLRSLQITDVVTRAGPRHTLKAGIDFVASRYDELDIRNIRGDFRFRGRATNPANQASSGFRAFADFLLGYLDQTQRQIGAEPAELRGWQLGAFLQDEWRVSRAVSLNLGLRYDLQAPLVEKSNRLGNFVPSLGEVVLAGDPHFPAALVERDTNNVSPRAGFAWRPAADGRTVVRGAAGIYYSLENFNVTRQQLAVSYPFVLREQYSRQGNNPASLTFANPYPGERSSTQGVNQPLGMAMDYRVPKYYHYNVTLERELGRDLTVHFGYVGSQGRHLGRRYNLNQPVPFVKDDGTFASVRPFPAFADIQFQDQTIDSCYHSMQASVRRRLSGGLSLLASYTLGRATDTGSISTGNMSNVSTSGSQKTPQNIHDMAAERGPADFHRTHQFAAAFAWDLPVGGGRRLLSDAGPFVNAMVGGWQMTGIVKALSGRPFTPQYAAGDFAAQRPDLVGDPNVNVPAGLAFNPTAFARPQATAANPGGYGNAGRNMLTGPGFTNFDLALSRSIRLPRSYRLQLRAEVFNAFNQVNYQLPVFLLDRSDVGRYTATANEAREWQLAVRFMF